MFKQLDVLIGFVVVMAIVSSLVMIITQVISSLFGLRGKNLLDGLHAMMRRIDPNQPTGTARPLMPTPSLILAFVGMFLLSGKVLKAAATKWCFGIHRIYFAAVLLLLAPWIGTVLALVGIGWKKEVAILA